MNETGKPKIATSNKYAQVAQRSVRLIGSLFALLGAVLAYAQKTTGSSSLTVTPSALTFTVEEGGPAPDSQTIAISGPNGTPITVGASIGLTSFFTVSVGGTVLQWGSPEPPATIPAIITVGVVLPLRQICDTLRKVFFWAAGINRGPPRLFPV